MYSKHTSLKHRAYMHTRTQGHHFNAHITHTHTHSYLPQAARGTALRILFSLHFALFSLPRCVKLLLQTACYKINLHLSRTFPSLSPFDCVSHSLPPTHNGFLLLLVLPPSPTISQPKQELNPACAFSLGFYLYLSETHSHICISVPPPCKALC